MSAVIEKAGLREQIATAANGSGETDILGAMGAASLLMVTNAAGDRVAKQTEIGTAEIHPNRRLASLIERAKYAKDRHSERPAALLFAACLGKKRAWCNRFKVKSGSDMLFKFAGLVVTEFIYDKCAQCCGGGFVALGKPGARNVLTTLCAVCQGNGLPRIDHKARAQALGVSGEVYEKHWRERFAEAKGWLVEIEASYMTPLQSQLRRDTLHTVSE